MRDQLFITLICFWTLLLIFSNVFNKELMKSSEIYQKQLSKEDVTFMDHLNSNLGIIPGFALIQPLFNIMTFRYSDIIPLWLTLILDMIAIFSVFIIATLIRGV